MVLETDIIATTTQDDVDPVSSYIWYKGYEGAGTTISDETGVGPVTTVNGTLTNVWDNSGWLTLNGSDIEALVGADAAVDSILDLSTLDNGQQMIISFDHYFDGAIAAAQHFFFWGENGIKSGWGISTNTSEQVIIQMRGVAGVSLEANVFPAYNFNALGAQRNTFTIELIGRGGNTADANLYVNGSNTAISSIAGIDLLASGISAPSDTGNDGLTLFARKTITATDRWLEGRMSNIFMMRKETEYTALAIAVNKEFYNKQGDLPGSLDGM